MYSRSFYPTENANPPENYNGTVFGDDIPVFEPTAFEEPVHAEPTLSKSTAEEKCEKPTAASAAGIFGLPFLSGLGSGSFSLDSLFSSIGLEEILILAVAAFLFFSRDGDSECALLLLLLLFVK